MTNFEEQDILGLNKAYEQAYISYKKEGGIPIGACLINNVTGQVLGVGHNERVQKDSPILHGETSCLANIGRLPAKIYKVCTLYTTLSPCAMCSGTCILYDIKRIVIGENKTFLGEEELLKSRSVELIVVDDERCKNIMAEFISEKPELWNEDIGEE